MTLADISVLIQLKRARNAGRPARRRFPGLANADADWPCLFRLLIILKVQG
jgi:hypothetical protein